MTKRRLPAIDHRQAPSSISNVFEGLAGRYFTPALNQASMAPFEPMFR